MIKKKNFIFDSVIEQFYKNGLEKDRLTHGTSELERDRTLQIFQKFLPSAPAVIYDIGGAAGAYAFVLSQQGYEVHLVDPVSLHIEQAQTEAKKSGIQLASYAVGDARALTMQDQSADVVLLLGPLYHLIDKQERIQALSEAYRVLKPNGLIIAAAISRFASMMDGLYQGMFLDPSYRELIKQDLNTGMHLPGGAKNFTNAYLHHPQQFREEFVQAGFTNITLHAVEGPVWDEQSIERLKQDRKIWKELLSFIESIESDETIIGASAHMLGVALRNR